MDTEFRDHDELHLLGENATRSMEPRWGALAALLVLAGMSPPRRRVMPARTSAPHRGPLGRVQLRFLGLEKTPVAGGPQFVLEHQARHRQSLALQLRGGVQGGA